MNKEIALKLIESQREISSSGCWIWIGGKSSAGYGLVHYNWAIYYVHRLSAFIYLDLDLDSSLQVLHKNTCHNPSCFNPEHLYIGTALDNANDRNILITYCKHGHLFSPENTYIQPKTGKRQCRQCKADREYYKRLNNGNNMSLFGRRKYK